MSDFRPEIYAIDFGTSNSLLAAANRGGVHPPVPLDERASDPTLLRSVLFFPSADRCFYGSEAVEQYVANGMEGRLIRSIKKHLASRSLIGTQIHDRSMRLEELVAAMLREMKRRADRFFAADVKRVMLGRPARFSLNPEDDAFGERRLRAAANLAGFEEVNFCPEPIAAGRDFAEQLTTPKLVLVADFGGGTSDFTVVRMRRDQFAPEDVISMTGVATAGDAYDGCIMRSRIANHFGSGMQYRVPTGGNILTMPKPLIETLCSPADISILRRRDVRSFLRDLQSWAVTEEDRRRVEQLFTLVDDSLGFAVFEAIESAKKELSQADRATVSFSYPTIEISEEIEQGDFASMSERTTERIVASLDEALHNAKKRPEEIELVCLTGGTARVPPLAAALRERFPSERMHALRSFHSVIQGLAERAHAWLLTGNSTALNDSASLRM